MNRVAVYGATRAMYPYLETALKSLLYHNGADHVHLLLEDDTFPVPPQHLLTVHNVSGQRFFPPDGPNITEHWTYMALMKLALPLILPVTDRALWLDADTIVRDDISPIWQTDLSGCYAAMVLDRDSDGQPHYNDGVCLFNLSMIRRDGLVPEMIRDANTTHYGLIEQEILNRHMRGRLHELPAEYNAMYHLRNYPPGHARIFHTTTMKPPSRSGIYQHYAHLSWEEVMSHRSGLENVTKV